MAIDIKLPDLGENIESGDVVSVLVKEGDEIQAEQGVLEIETGKAVVELPSPYAGRITKIHVKKGDKVKVGAPLMSLESAATEAAQPPPQKSSPQTKPAKKAVERAEQSLEPKENLKEEVKRAVESSPAAARPAKEKSKAQPASSSATASAGETPAPQANAAQSDGAASAPATPAAGSRRIPPAGPATRRLARELGVDLSRVSGSGPGGRITEEDVKAAVRATKSAPPAVEPAMPALRAAPLPEGTADHDPWGPIRRQPMTGIRKAIAAAMTKSATTIPQLTNFDDADVTELERIRKTGLADYVDSSVKLTMMAFVIKAVAQSLKLHPLVNASIDAEKNEIVFKDYIHIGVAVDTDRGLVVPVVRNVDRLSIPRIAVALSGAAEQARGGRFSPDDLKGATFTISNLGSIGGTYSTPIINPPNVAILLVGRSRKMPVVVDDKIEIRLMMPLSLTYDHRVVDGAAAARFLNEVIDYLHVPGRLLLAP